jgi:MFS family permease
MVPLSQRSGRFHHFRRRIPSFARIVRPLDSSLKKTSDVPLKNGHLLGLRFLWLDGLFSAMSDNFVLGFMELFLLAYHADNTRIGLVSATASLLAMCSLIPGARIVERLGKRKGFILLTAGGIGRVTLLVVAALPLVIRNSTVAIVCLISLNAVRAFMSNVCNPGWTTLVADLVPTPMRGRYFASRNAATIVATAIAAPAAGFITKSFNAGPNGAPVSDLPYLGFQLIYFISFAIGMAGTASFARIPEPVREPQEPRKGGMKALLKELGSDRRFVGLCASAFVWNLFVNVGGPFFNVYLVNGLGATLAFVGLSTGITCIGSFIGQPVFGKISDRKGDIFVQTFTGLLIPILPLIWTIATAPYQILILNLFGNFIWAGYNLASFNILLKMTPDDRKADAVALYQTVVLAGSAIGPIVGGAVADAAGYKVVFALSSAGRYVGMAIFIFMVAKTQLGKKRG